MEILQDGSGTPAADSTYLAGLYDIYRIPSQSAAQPLAWWTFIR